MYYHGSVIVHEGGRDVPSLTKWIEESMANDGENVIHPKAPPPPPPPPPPFISFSI
jgi:hypothetical protein